MKECTRPQDACESYVSLVGICLRLMMLHGGAMHMILALHLL